MPTVTATGWTEAQKRAYVIVDNRLAENAGWDVEMLKTEFADLDDLGFDLSLLGFDESEIGDLLADTDTTEPLTDPDEIPEPEETPVTRTGDIWTLGNHRLMCGDSTNGADVALLMDGERADMVFTDPPWNVNYGATHNPNWKSRTIENDNMSTEDFREFLSSVFAQAAASSHCGAMVYVVMSAQEWGSLMQTMAEHDFHWSSTIIWKKDTLILSRKDYHTQYEPIWYGWLDGAARLHPLDDRTQSDVWEFDRPKRSDEHPTMKPVALVERAIENSSAKGNVVLDLFGGSGTTLIAAETTGRRCRMMELAPKFCDVIIQRWQNLTGKQATMNGKTYEQLREERNGAESA